MNSGPPETYIFDRRKPTYLDYHLQLQGIYGKTILIPVKKLDMRRVLKNCTIYEKKLSRGTSEQQKNIML